MSQRNKIDLGPNREKQVFSQLLGEQMKIYALVGLKTYGLVNTFRNYPYFFFPRRELTDSGLDLILSAVDEASRHITNTRIYNDKYDIRYNLNSKTISDFTRVLGIRGGIPYVETDNNEVILSYRSSHNSLVKEIVSYLNPNILKTTPTVDICFVNERIDLVSLYNDIYLPQNFGRAPF